MSQKKILIVDDDIDERRLIRLLLKDFDFEIIEASDGEEGVMLATAMQPDLIIFDHRMPKLTGYEAIKRIQMDSRLKKIPIIMMTAQRFDPQMKEMIKMDVVEYIPKPFDRVVFLNAIKKIFQLDKVTVEQKKKIFLYTESIEVRAVIKTQLGEGYEVIEINNANEMLKKLETTKPNLIISNIKLLGWGSLEGKKLLSQVVALRIPLVMEIFTEIQDTIDISALKTPDLVHMRPFSVEDLREFVEKILK
jgi:CheY-like chemotaxis protein